MSASHDVILLTGVNFTRELNMCLFCPHLVKYMAGIERGTHDCTILNLNSKTGSFVSKERKYLNW